MKTKITEKIKKLLALSDSPNKNEAEAALKKALLLMGRHSIADEDLKERKYHELLLWEGQRLHPCMVPVLIVVSEFNVLVIKSRGRIRIFGTTENLEIARYVFEYLCQTFKTLSYKNKITYTSGYYMGLKDSILKTLRSAKEQIQEEGLVLVDEHDAVKEWYQKEYGAKVSAHRCSFNSDQRDLGREHGKNIRINPAIKEKQTETLRLE